MVSDNVYRPLSDSNGPILITLLHLTVFVILLSNLWTNSAGLDSINLPAIIQTIFTQTDFFKVPVC